MLIQFFSSIRDITGEKGLQWDEPTPTLRELLVRLSERYGPRLQRWLLEGEELGSSVLVLINGEDVRHGSGLVSRLQPDDIVAILPMMAGGAKETRE